MNPNKSNKTPSEITIDSTVFSRRKSGVWSKNPSFFPGLKKAVYAQGVTHRIKSGDGRFRVGRHKHGKDKNSHCESAIA